MKRALFLVLSIFWIIFIQLFTCQSQAIKVDVIQKDGKWMLLRKGEPYFIKGAGGDTHLDKLVKCGGNSIRTWSTDNAGEILDKAQENGLTVMLGLWVQHERHGFDYNDVDAVKQQFEKFKEVVLLYKDHPALLLWGIGNEVDLQYTNYKVWDAIQDISVMIHQLDGNHPTTTVTAGLNEKNLKLILEKASDLDFYSVNTYGDLGNINVNLKKFGYTGPYIVTEWGPNGHWEVPKTNWGIPIEQNSHEKALSYFERYNDYILGDQDHCIGSYVFLWGQKQETTTTWYGMFTREGYPTEVIDYMERVWTGEWPSNRAPSMDSVFLNNLKAGTDIYLTADYKYNARVYVSDEAPSALKIQWEIVPESDDIKSGGDFERAPQPLLGLIKKKKDQMVTFRTPGKEGAFRLFVFVSDRENKVAYANIPFYVLPDDNAAGQNRSIELKKRELQIDE